MRNLSLVFCLGLMLLLLNPANAFPLSGGNGQTSITIFGTIRDENTCYVDMGAPVGFWGKISLVDEEDKFYALSSGGIDHQPGRARAYAIFPIPKSVNIKRVKFEPLDQIPFSIDWEAYPEVSDENATMKLYNVAASPFGEDLRQWIFDIKLTNNYTEPFKVRTDDFTITDQFGWEYGYACEIASRYTVCSSQIGQLMPGESMRLDLDFRWISALSRPAELRYRNLTMDVSAWT